MTPLWQRATIEMVAMINRFALQEFKGHRDTQLELGRFTMLVGDNASGKTSVLEALSLQAGFGDNPVRALHGRWSPEDLLRRGSDGPIVFCPEGTRGGRNWSMTLKLQVRPTESDKRKKSWELALDGQLDGVWVTETALGIDDDDDDDQSHGGWGRVTEMLGIARSYHLRAEQIATAAYSNQPEAAIEADGTNTAVALAAMKLGNDEAFQRVEDALRKLIPAVERIRIRPATVLDRSLETSREVVGSKLYFDFRGAPGVPAHGASHGTLIVLALLAILHGPNRPDLILLDDFDHALHPRAQMDLVRMIKSLLEIDEFNDLQVVATTHSPYVLDELEPSGVYAFALRDDGTVASKRLSEHPDAKKTRGTLKAGQLWSLDPERDWVLRR